MTHPVEELASKAMGAVKAGKATLHGLTGIFTTLAEEHGEVTALLLRVRSSSEGKVRAELFPKIRAELLSHESAEMKVLYPAYREYPEIAAIADEHDEQATELQELIDKLAHTEYQDPKWAHEFDALIALVKQHAAEEETDYFVKAQRVFGERAKQLESEYKSAKRAALDSLA
jgi:hypothetical protein